jgi:hypothetical protein
MLFPRTIDLLSFRRWPSEDGGVLQVKGPGILVIYVNGQSELLASRLQNYHLSNSEKLVQQPAKTSPDLDGRVKTAECSKSKDPESW